MPAENIRNVVIVGAGTMGPGIAATCARYGYTTTLSDIDAAQVDKARRTLDFVFTSLVAGGLMTQADVEAARNRLTLTQEPDAAVVDADLIIENVSERLETKRSVLQQLCERASADAILASDTSGIPISALQAGMKNPGRIVGMHWSNPPHLIPVIEVIRGQETDAATVRTTVAVVESMAMVAGLVDRDVPGFVENRILYAIMREALHLLDEGVASAEAIDTIVKWGIGYKLAVIGPLALLDVAGLDIYAAVASYLNKDLCNDASVSTTILRRVADGKLGLKTQGGLFDYTPDEIARLASERGRLLMATRTMLRSGGG